MMPSVSIILNGLKGFSDKFGCALIIKKTADVKVSDIYKCDVVMSIRGNSSLSKRIMKYAKKNNKKYILAIDDDLLHLADMEERFPLRIKDLNEIIKSSDIIFTGNRLLGEEYASMSAGKRYAVVNTPVETENIVKFDGSGVNESNKNNKIRIVYAAGESHYYFFNKYIMPIMPNLRDNYKDMISMTFIGVKPDLSQYEKDMDIKYVKGMPFQKYIDYMKLNKFDIGLAPLEANHFCERKYFNKYIEYSTYGICGVYSNCAPYTLIVKNNINGFLCDNNDESWIEGLVKAIKDSSSRTQCIINAQLQLINEFDPDKIYDKMFKDMPELAEYKASERCNCHFFWLAKIEYIFFKFFSNVYLFFHSLKKDGLGKTIDKVTRKLKKYKKILIYIIC